MAWVTSTVIAVAEIAAAVTAAAGTAASAGLTYYGQQQQAKNQRDMASYNLAIQKNNANINARVAQQQANLNASIAQANATAHQNTAQTYANQATAVQNQAVAEAQQMRLRNQRFQATQVNRTAAGGVVGTEGTPLVDLADSAVNLEATVKNTLYEGDLNAKSWQQRGLDEKYQAGYSLLDASVAQYQERAAAVGRSVQLDTAAGNYAAAENQAAGTTLASYGTLLSGAAQTAGSAYDLYQGGGFGGTKLAGNSVGGAGQSRTGSVGSLIF